MRKSVIGISNIFQHGVRMVVFSASLFIVIFVEISKRFKGQQLHFCWFLDPTKKGLRKCDSAQIIILMIICLKLYPTLFWKLKKIVLIWENNSLIVFIYGLHFSIKNVFFIGYTYLFQRKKLQNVSHVQLVRLKVHQLIEMSS